MKNQIVVGMVFYFKGEKYNPSLTLDLDDCMTKRGNVPQLVDALARHNGIDTYSYLFEVMQSEELQYSDATGLAADFLDGDVFDVAGFERAWEEQRVMTVAAAIAKEEMGVDDLAQVPGLKNALLRAYVAGKATA